MKVPEASAKLLCNPCTWQSAWDLQTIGNHKGSECGYHPDHAALAISLNLKAITATTKT